MRTSSPAPALQHLPRLQPPVRKKWKFEAHCNHLSGKPTHSGQGEPPTKKTRKPAKQELTQAAPRAPSNYVYDRPGTFLRPWAGADDSA